MIDRRYLKLCELKYFFNTYLKKKIFIISGKNSYFKSGAKDFLKKYLKDHNIKYFFKKSYYPEIKELIQLINSIHKYKPDLILAIGGGSVIDYAKIANIENIEKNTIFKITKSNHLTDKKYAKLFTIPTTAGSGAEVTSNAVIYINKIKYSLEGENLIPNYFSLIPQILVKNKNKLKSSAGFDAISQAVESIISVRSTSDSLKFAYKSLDLSLSNYIDFLKKPSISNSNNMALAAMYSGKAISISKTTAPHAVSYPFTSLYGISHGHAVSLTLEKFLKFNYENIDKSISEFSLKNRYNKLFKIFKVKNIYDLQYKIMKIKKDAKLNDNFTQLNINIDTGINKILDGINIERLKNNPIKLTRKDIGFILKQKK